jgi:spore germination protein YaaH
LNIEPDMPDFYPTSPIQPTQAFEGPEVFDIRSIDLVRQYVEHLAAKRTGFDCDGVQTSRAATDWDEICQCIAGSESLEEAIGRAVVVADLMSRGLYESENGGKIDQEDSNHFFSFDNSTATAHFGDKTRLRTWINERVSAHRALTSVVVSVATILSALTISMATVHGGTAPTAFKKPVVRVVSGNAQLQMASLADVSAPVATTTTSTVLPAATTPPAPAPPSLADAPPLRPHEVFGFAPYWTLGQSSGFDVSRISTFAYFSIPVNGDGSLQESGPGWNGFQSQQLSDLITRAHAVGDRVVLTVNSFDQNTLNQLTSSPTAPSTLASALLGALREKNLDGVNLDLEGTGDSDQAGLTHLVTSVSDAIHGANPHYQVTMDTYASSAGDPNGFYNIRTLAPAVDGFFVMQYQLNLQSGGSTTSPLTSTMFSDKDSIDQYLAAVPASKIILGMPYFGIDWPTSNGTLTAQATGPATPVADGQVFASGHPIYWDTTTDTAWTSYQVGSQWHETFFENPTSLYDAAQLADAGSLAGVGIWALGMDGNDPSMLSALLGFAPAVKNGEAGPSTTSASPTSSTTSTSESPSSTTSSTSTTSTTLGDSPAGQSTSTTSTGPESTTTSSVPTSSEGQTSSYQYTGTWKGQEVELNPIFPGVLPITGAAVGSLSDFSTNDPQLSCLATGPGLSVQPVNGNPDEYVVEAVEPGYCADAFFTFVTTS